MPHKTVSLSAMISVLFSSSAFAVEPLECNPSQDQLTTYIEAKLNWTSHLVPIPRLQGYVFQYTNYANYKKNPSRKFWCSSTVYGEGRYWTNFTVKETNQKIECENSDIIHALTAKKYIEGERWWDGVLLRHEHILKKTNKWSELEPWLVTKNGKEYWQAKTTAKTVEVVDFSASQGNNDVVCLI